MKKLLAIGMIAVLLASLFVGTIPSSLASPDWVIDGDTVYTDDANVYLSATPHTITSWGWVYFNLTSKKYNGDIDCVWGFNLPTVKPTKAELYHPHWDNTTTNHERFFYNVSFFSPSSDACDFGNSYNPHHYNVTYETCDVWNETTFECEGYNTLSSIVCFDSYTNESNNYTAYWHTEHPNWVLWKDVSSSFTKVNHDYGGMNTWYYVKNVPVEAGKSYQVRAWVDIAPSLDKTEGKYWWAIKPSSETIPQAIANNHFYALDPWIDDPGWSYKKVINITGQSGAGAFYQVNFSIGDSSGGDFHLEGHCTDFPNDTVVTDDDGTTKLPLWIEDPSVDPIQMWVNVSDDLNASQDICIYYGKLGESSASNGANTFPNSFDDFNRADSPTVGNGWTDTGSAAIESNKLKIVDSGFSNGVEKACTFNSDLIFEWKGNVVSGSDGEVFSEIRGNENNQRLGISIRPPAEANGFRLLYSGAPWSAVGSASYDTDYRLKIIWHESASNADLLYHDGSWHTGASGVSGYASTEHNEVLFYGNQDGQVGYVYFVFVRKYNNPEPAFSSAGSEESAPADAYIPPTPTNLQNTTGNFYVNFTWDAGSGNVTDSYNISNETGWTNGTTNTYFNESVGASGWLNITVYAFNSSGNGTLSTSNVSDQVQAPSVSTKKLYETHTSDFSAEVAVINLSDSRDGTANNVDYQLASGNLYNYINATSTDTVGQGRKIPVDAKVRFSAYFDDGDRVNNAYATWKVYKVYGSTAVLICQKGDDSTGGVQIPDGTTETITGYCTPSSDVTLNSSDKIRVIMNVWAQTIGDGGAATKVAKHYWDDTHESWIEYEYQLTAAEDTTFSVSLPSGYTYPSFSPPNSTATNYPPGGQTDSQEFFNVSNDGNVNLDVTLQLNATVADITLKADTDNDPTGSQEIATSPVTIHSGLQPSNYLDVWIWSDFDHTVEQETNKTLYINVTT